MITTKTLPNGVRIVTYNIPQVKSVHVNVAVKGGSLVEKTEKNGVAHFMEHMLVQGIPSFPTVEALATHVEGLAGSYNAYTSQLSVAFLITLPFIHLKNAIQIASEVIFSPLFPEASIEKERQAVINEITQRKDSLGYKLGKTFKDIRFAYGSLLHRDIGGSLEAVKELTREDMLAYWKQYFVPQNTYLYIGGNFDDEQLQSLLETYFGNTHKDNSFEGFPTLSPNDFSPKGVFIKEDKKLGTNYVTLSFPTFGLEANWQDTVKQDLALTILGQLRTSRLFSLLRYQKGLVYNVSSQRVLMPNIGYIDIDCEVATEHLTEVITLITQTLQDMITHGPTEKELQFVKEYYTSSWLMAFDNPASAAEWLEEELLWEEKVRTPEECIRLIKDISAKDITDVIQRYWDLDNIQLLIQGPQKDEETQREKYAELLGKIKA